QIKNKDEKGVEYQETPAESLARTHKILGDEGFDKLYGKDIVKGDKKKGYANSIKARQDFMAYLAKEVLAKPEKQYSGIREGREIAGSRETNPEEHACKLKELLGPEGVELFIKAVAEEA